MWILIAIYVESDNYTSSGIIESVRNLVDGAFWPILIAGIGAQYAIAWAARTSNANDKPTS